SSFIPVAEHVGAVPVLALALAVVPATGVAQLPLVLGTSTTAPEQTSFTGGGGGVPTQISKVALVVDVDTQVQTLTLYSVPGVRPVRFSVSGSLHADCTKVPHAPL